MLTLGVRVDLGGMELKEYFTLPRAPELYPHHQMQLSKFGITSKHSFILVTVVNTNQ